MKNTINRLLGKSTVALTVAGALAPLYKAIEDLKAVKAFQDAQERAAAEASIAAEDARIEAISQANRTADAKIAIANDAEAAAGKEARAAAANIAKIEAFLA